MARPTLILLLFPLTLLLSNCEGNDCDDSELRHAEFPFYVVDAVTGENMIVDEPEENSKSYDIDSIKIYDENFNRVESTFSDFSNSSGYMLGISYMRKELGVEDLYEPGSATFYLYLNESDTDTILVEYDYDPGNPPCEYVVKKFELYFNGEPTSNIYK